MQYYHYHMDAVMPQTMKETLQRYFPNNDFGVSCIAGDKTNNEVSLVTIDKVCGNTWTHYANIQRVGGDEWELNEQFKGENEDEMWIYGRFKSFGAAVRNLATKGTHGRKPIEIYK